MTNPNPAPALTANKVVYDDVIWVFSPPLLPTMFLGKSGGDKNMQSHSHTIGGGQNQWVRGGTGDSAANITQSGAAFRVVNGPTDTAGTGNSGNLQPYKIANYIIKS